MRLLLECALIIFFIGVSALYSGLETGGYLLNRIRLRFLARQRENRAARHLQSVLRDAHGFVFTVLIAQNIAVYLISRSVTQLYLRGGFDRHAAIYSGVTPIGSCTVARGYSLFPIEFSGRSPHRSS